MINYKAIEAIEDKDAKKVVMQACEFFEKLNDRNIKAVSIFNTTKRGLKADRIGNYEENTSTYSFLIEFYNSILITKKRFTSNTYYKRPNDYAYDIVDKLVKATNYDVCVYFDELKDEEGTVEYSLYDGFIKPDATIVYSN